VFVRRIELVKPCPFGNSDRRKMHLGWKNRSFFDVWSAVIRSVRPAIAVTWHPQSDGR
jgi:hypothetical protein